MRIEEIARAIPHETRVKILLEWIPNAKPTLSNPFFKMLWETYFTYVDPNGIKKEDCIYCLQDVLKNWKDLQPALIEEEQNYNALEKI